MSHQLVDDSLGGELEVLGPTLSPCTNHDSCELLRRLSASQQRKHLVSDLVETNRLKNRRRYTVSKSVVVCRLLRDFAVNPFLNKLPVVLRKEKTAF